MFCNSLFNFHENTFRTSIHFCTTIYAPIHMTFRIVRNGHLRSEIAIGILCFLEVIRYNGVIYFLRVGDNSIRVTALD